MRLPAAVALACLLVGGTAVAREHHEHRGDARHHLEKANALAGEGKCAAAVREYTAAFDVLLDPIVLFNRGECYRRLGENAKAAADYRGYLQGFPAAPNRAEIEARIAALERPAAKPAPRTTAPPPVARATPPAPSPAPAPVAAPPPMPFLPPPPAGGEPTTLVEAPRSTAGTPAEATRGSHTWIWVTVAVVVAGAGAGGYLLLRPKDQPLPTTTLGNYRF